jgi:hypothetical protein
MADQLSLTGLSLIGVVGCAKIIYPGGRYSAAMFDGFAGQLSGKWYA